MTTLLAILAHPLVEKLVVLLVLGLLGKHVKDKSRRDRILAYARQAFDVAEMMGLHQGMTGAAKYALFVRQIVQKLDAAKDKPLTPSEREMLDLMAQEMAWLKKKPPAPTPKLPLPAPKL